jgi:hypothetical protein
MALVPAVPLPRTEVGTCKPVGTTVQADLNLFNFNTTKHRAIL